MKKIYKGIIAIICIGIVMPIYSRDKVGLVLSGGGARGIAHVGVIKALEDAGIPIDYITGTSMGAIVGALYACGYTPEEMMQLFTSEDFLNWASGTINPEDVYYFDRPEPTPSIVSVQLGLRDSVATGIAGMRANIIDPTPMNIAFLKLFTPYTAQCDGDFNNLFVPYRCVYSDVYHKHKVIGKKGSLGRNVRASMSFPMVYEPIEMNGVLVYDGGIYDNFPVDVMRDEFKPDFMVGVSVSLPDGPPIPGNAYSQLEDMIIQNNDYSLADSLGVKIQVPVSNYAVLDFPKAEDIYKIGYATGKEWVDSIQKRTSARESKEQVSERRKIWNWKTPTIEFTDVEVVSANPPAASYVKRYFTKENEEDSVCAPFGLVEAQQRYYRALSGQEISYILPEATTSPSGTSVLKLRVREQGAFKLGVGGWLTSSVNSSMYARASWHNMGSNMLKASLSGWIGQSYGALSGEARLRFNTEIPTALRFEGVLSRKKYYAKDCMFYDEDTRGSLSSTQNFARIIYEIAAGQHAKTYITGSYGSTVDKFYSSTMAEYMALGRDRNRYRQGVIAAGFRGSTLNYYLYPTRGKEFLAELGAIYTDARFMAHGMASESMKNKFTHVRVRASWKEYFQIATTPFTLGVMATGAARFGALKQNYVAEMASSEVFAPLPSVSDLFNYHLRGTNLVALGIMPIWEIATRLQLRGDVFYVTSPRPLKWEGTRRASYGQWFSSSAVMGQVSGVITLPFATAVAYANYLTRGGWNFGVSIGLYFEAARLLSM